MSFESDITSEVRLLRKALDNNILPNDLIEHYRALFSSILEALDSGDFTGVIQQADKADALEDENHTAFYARCYYIAGKALVQQNNKNKAQEAFAKALPLGEKNYKESLWIPCMLGYIQTLPPKQYKEEALALLQKTYSIAKQHQEGWINDVLRAMITFYKKQKRVDEALEAQAKYIKRLENQHREKGLIHLQNEETIEQIRHVLSHDFKEPARHVGAMATILEKRLETDIDEKTHAILRTLIESGQRMSEMVEGLYTYLTTGQEKENNVSFCLTEALERAKHELSVLIYAEHVTITHSDLPTVKSNKTLWTLLFIHLLKHAICYKAPDRPPVISVGAKADIFGQHIISIQSNGIGVSIDKKVNPFNLFPKEPVKKIATQNIDLAISKKIAIGLGVTIQITNDAAGSCFNLMYTP